MAPPICSITHRSLQPWLTTPSSTAVVRYGILCWLQDSTSRFSPPFLLYLAQSSSQAACPAVANSSGFRGGPRHRYTCHWGVDVSRNLLWQSLPSPDVHADRGFIHTRSSRLKTCRLQGSDSSYSLEYTLAAFEHS